MGGRLWFLFFQLFLLTALRFNIFITNSAIFSIPFMVTKWTSWCAAWAGHERQDQAELESIKDKPLGASKKRYRRRTSKTLGRENTVTPDRFAFLFSPASKRKAIGCMSTGDGRSTLHGFSINQSDSLGSVKRHLIFIPLSCILTYRPCQYANSQAVHVQNDLTCGE